MGGLLRAVAVAGLVAMVVGVSGCGAEDRPEARRYAAGLCGALERCGCGFWFSSGEACEAEMVARFYRAAEGRTVDVTCVDGYVAGLEDAACDEVGWSYDPEVICVAIRGDRKNVEDCTEPRGLPFLAVRDCQEGLICTLNGVCGLPASSFPALREEGDACDPQIAPFCDPDLYCGEDHRCHLRPGPGEPCAHTYECTHGTHYCAGGGENTPGVCRERLALDAACDPRDHLACADAEDSDSLRSCSLTLGRCVAEAQAICGGLSHPWNRPADGGA